MLELAKYALVLLSVTYPPIIIAENCAHLNINSDTHFGAIGVVNANMISDKRAKELSRKIADLELTKISASKVEQTYYFNKDIYQGAISITGKNDLQSCTNLRCDFANCRPAWLCELSSMDARLVSVSHRATSLTSQFNYLKKNLDDILSFLNHSRVSYEERFLQVQEKDYSVKHNSTTHSVEPTESLATLARIRGFCFTDNDTLFAQYLVPEHMFKAIEDDQLIGKGLVENIIATGLISDKIELSIKRALVDLAKQKHISVDSKVEIRRSEKGFFKLTDVRNSGDTLIVADVVSLTILPDEKDYTIKSSVVELKTH